VDRPRDREEHAVGNVLRLERVDVLVDLPRTPFVTAKADSGEVRLDEPRVDGGEVDRPAEEVLPEGVGKSADGKLRRDVDGGILVRLPAGDGTDVDDVSAVVDVRQAEAGHAQQAGHVRLDHGGLVLVGRVPERVAAQAEAGVVDEDVDPAEVGDGALDEALGALAVGDVEIEGVKAFAVGKLLDASRSDGDSGAGLRERVGGGCPDPARGAGDDSRLVLE
jgi:hypothetical protein